VEAPELIMECNSTNLYNSAIIKKIATERNVIFLNYNQDLISNINHNKELYYDFGHLNQEGSTIFTTKLASDINAIIAKSQQCQVNDLKLMEDR
jgi:hypothetical protein